MNRLVSLSCVVIVSALAQERSGPIPRFEDYPEKQAYKGKPVSPILKTPEERRYRTRIREGFEIGRGVWTGSWKDAKESAGPNFAGHYIVIRWGCGADCLMMAIADAETGLVYKSPMTQPGSEFAVPMDPLSDREIDFKPGSTLMVFRNVCQKYRETCGMYAFNWKDKHFNLVTRTIVDLTKAHEIR